MGSRLGLDRQKEGRRAEAVDQGEESLNGGRKHRNWVEGYCRPRNCRTLEERSLSEDRSLKYGAGYRHPRAMNDGV